MNLINLENITALEPIPHKCKYEEVYRLNTDYISWAVLSDLLLLPLQEAIKLHKESGGLYDRSPHDTAMYILGLMYATGGTTSYLKYKGNEITGLIVMGEVSTVHCDNAVGTYVNFNLSGEYKEFWKAVRKDTVLDGYSWLVISKHLGARSFSNKFIQLK